MAFYLRAILTSPIFYSVVGALLFLLAWPVSPLTFFIFVAWVPLLWLEQTTSNTRKFFLLLYLHMLLWNLFVTWWVAKSTITGGIAAFMANSLLMCIPILLFRFTKKKTGNWLGYGSFILYWMAFEYIHLNWDLSWPWLTLGNAFATQTNWIQWYEFTGASGGSFWILLSNVVAFALINNYRLHGRSRPYFISMAAWLIVLVSPILLSISMNKEEKLFDLAHAPGNIVVVQPNIDPWDEKFAAGKQEAQLQKLIALSESQIDANTRLVVWPETAIPFEVQESKLNSNYFVAPVWAFMKRHPQVHLLTGLEGGESFQQKNSRYSTPFNNGGGFYESYNSAVLMDSNAYTIYHKSRLVPGVEVLPAFLDFMSSIFEKFGGTGGGYARDTAAHVLQFNNLSYKIAPAICYESIYGEYVAEFVRKGANIICVITNDGWWGNTAGHKQHMNYARLRAIETRRWVARSANTGISCFIDPLGAVHEPQPWDTEAVIKMPIPVNEEQTFFVRHGDMLSTACLFVAGILLLLSIIIYIRQRIEKQKGHVTENDQLRG